MVAKKAKSIAKKATIQFYKLSLKVEKENSPFYPEFSILAKTTEAVNSFNSLYKSRRSGARGGPSTHDQQDLYRAMLIFACAGLDTFVKQLVKSKLPKLINVELEAEKKFKEYVKSGLKKDDKAVLNTVALALIDKAPRNIFLEEYIENLTANSLQSVSDLCKISDASGLETKQIFSPQRMNSLKDAFIVRNQIIHEMDITVSASTSRTTGYRTRRQRVSSVMEKHTRSMLDLGQDLFGAYKDKFEKYKIEVEKALP